MTSPYLTAAAWASRLGVSRELTARWCRAGRVPGAYKAGPVWLVPADARRPARLSGRASKAVRQ